MIIGTTTSHRIRDATDAGATHPSTAAPSTDFSELEQQVPSQISEADPAPHRARHATAGDAIRGERWIVVVEEPFLPVDAGGRVETFTFLEAALAAGVGLQVLVPTRETLDIGHYERSLPGAAVIALPRDDSVSSHLSNRPFVQASRPVGPLQRALAKTPRRADAVISYSVRSAHLGERIARRWQIPHLVRAHNIDSEYFRVLARSTSGVRVAAYLLEYHKMRWAERMLHHSKFVTCLADISIEDHEWRRTRASVPTFHLPPFLPTRTLAPGGRPGAAERIPDRLIFVGSLDTPPNIEALRWFLDRCWPAIRARRPAASLDIVGRRAPTGLLDRLAGYESVAVHVDVPSVDDFVAAASVSLNPMQSGSGVNIKVVEAMATATPVVSTETGSRGLGWRPGRDIIVAKRPDAFVDAVCHLLAEPVVAKKIGEAGRDFVVTELNWEGLIQRIRTHLGTSGS